MKPYVVVSEYGERTWLADDKSHAIEQHMDAFPDEAIQEVYEWGNDERTKTDD